MDVARGKGRTEQGAGTGQAVAAATAIPVRPARHAVSPQRRSVAASCGDSIIGSNRSTTAGDRSGTVFAGPCDAPRASHGSAAIAAHTIGATARMGTARAEQQSRGSK